MRRTGLAIALAAVAVLLGGCAAAAPTLPPRPEGAALEKAIADAHANNWRWWSEGFSDVEAQPVEVEEILLGAQWRDAILLCFEELGVDDVMVEVDHVSVVQGTDDYEEESARFQGVFECTGRYPEPWMTENVMSAEERGFLYDYSKNVLAPCVRSAGYEVPPLPERDAYVRQEQYWWAYESLFRDQGTNWDSSDELAFQRVLLRCPELPAGWNER